MKLPNARRALVDKEKITEYLLSTTSPGGRTKARFFLRFGFEAKRWREFADALRALGAVYEVVRAVETVYGFRYNVEGAIRTPDGRDPGVVTVWQVDQGSDFPRLITAYPRRRKR